MIEINTASFILIFGDFTHNPQQWKEAAMRAFVIALVALLGLAAVPTSTEVMAQASYNVRQYGAQYQRASAQAAALVNNAGQVQNAIGAQRAAFNRGMASRDPRARAQARQNFIRYLDNLQRSLLAAENAHNAAIGAGNNYARALLQVQRTSAQGRQVAAQVQGLRNAQRSLRATRESVQREARAAGQRR